MLNRHIATLLSSGISLTRALDICINMQNKIELKNLIHTIKIELRKGKPFHEILTHYPRYFSNIFINLIKIGELSGSLDIMLVRLADYLEKTVTLKKQIKKMLYYPFIIITFTIITGIVLILFIMPQFETLFKSFNADLPWLTRLIIYSSHLLQAYGYIIFSCLALGVYFFIRLFRTSQRLRKRIDYLFLTIPILGTLLKASIITRFSQTLTTTLAAGIPILVALDNVANITSNLIYTSAIKKIKDDVAMGQQIHHAMMHSRLFPNMMVQMIATGEESGNLVAMLEKITDFYQAEVSNKVEIITALMEPFLMIILGIIIAVFVLAMYLPIFKLGSIV